MRGFLTGDDTTDRIGSIDRTNNLGGLVEILAEMQIQSYQV
jgi:hypothetical protein